MKKFLILAVICTVGVFAGYAQTSDAETDAIVNLLGVQKKEAMTKLVSASGKDSVAFWKLYDEYQKKNMEMAKNRIKLYEQTAQAYGNMTEATADSLSRRYFSNRLDQEQSLQEYYKKIKAATNSVLAFEFYQGEVYLLTQIRASIMQQIPTYGQVKMVAKRKE